MISMDGLPVFSAVVTYDGLWSASVDANVQNLVGVGELTGRFSVLLCSGDTTPWFHLLHRLTPETACGVEGPFAAYTPSSGGVSVTFGTFGTLKSCRRLVIDSCLVVELLGAL